MKICWDEIRDIKFTRNGTFVKNNKTYIYEDSCSTCGDPYLTRKDKKGSFCSNSCARSGNNNPMKNKEVSRKNRANSKGNVRDKKIPLYDTYAEKIIYAEEVRKCYTSDGLEILEVRCTKCRNWFKPTDKQVLNRMRCLNGNRLGESRFYCSDECKYKCEIYCVSKYPKGFKKSGYRYGLKTWRKEVLKRANYECEYCGKKATDAHHERPIKIEPFFALDPDNGIACCEKCHYLYGHRDGCSTGSLASVICK